MLNFDLIPEQASTFAPRVDALFYFLTALVSALTIGISVAIVVLSVMFRKKPGEFRKSKALESPMLEVIWTVIPTVVGLGIFAWGAVLYNDFLNEPEGGLEIDVVAKRWMWKIQHPTGNREVDELHIPVGQPVKLTMTSQDVLHDFYIPAFRVKQDVIPGRFTKLWFEATKPGEYHLFCAEYCGLEHSLMIGTVYAMEPDDYAEWIQGGPKKPPKEAGAFLFEQRGCATCHSSRADSRGPDLDGVFGAKVRLSTGTEIVADEEYLRESIMESSKRIVEGYPALMPSFINLLTEEDVMNLIAYIKSLSGRLESTIE